MYERVLIREESGYLLTVAATGSDGSRHQLNPPAWVSEDNWFMCSDGRTVPGGVRLDEFIWRILERLLRDKMRFDGVWPDEPEVAG